MGSVSFPTLPGVSEVWHSCGACGRRYRLMLPAASGFSSVPAGGGCEGCEASPVVEDRQPAMGAQGQGVQQNSCAIGSGSHARARDDAGEAKIDGGAFLVGERQHMVDTSSHNSLKILGKFCILW